MSTNLHVVWIDTWEGYPRFKGDQPCAQIGFELFFVNPGDSVKAEAARRICGQCSYRVECAAYALRHPLIQGIWGGTTYYQREMLRRKSRKRKAS